MLPFRPQIVQIPNGLYDLGEGVNCIEPKSYRPQIASTIWGGVVNCTDPKLPVQFTPLNCKVRFGACTIWGLYDCPLQIIIVQYIFLTRTSCFASQRSFLRRTNENPWWPCCSIHLCFVSSLQKFDLIMWSCLKIKSSVDSVSTHSLVTNPVLATRYLKNYLRSEAWFSWFSWQCNLVHLTQMVSKWPVCVIWVFVECFNWIMNSN